MRKILLSITFIALFSTNVFAQENAAGDTVKSPVNEQTEEKSSIFINGSPFNFM
jgi:hypothetical protein